MHAKTYNQIIAASLSGVGRMGLLLLFALLLVLISCVNPTSSDSGGGSKNEVSNLSVVEGDGLLSLAWTNPSVTVDAIQLAWDTTVDGEVAAGGSGVGVVESFVVDGLQNGTEYEVRVSAVVEGAVSSGKIVTGTPTSDGARSITLRKYTSSVSHPAYVNLFFQALTTDGTPVPDLEAADFVVTDNGEAQNSAEAAIRIRKSDQLPYTLRTVVMLDNSLSVGTNLQQVKAAAKALVQEADGPNAGERDGETENQLISIWSFSASVVERVGFTSNVSDLNNAIDSISLGQGSTNLYQAVVTGVEQWTDSYTASAVDQGTLVILSDGEDTGGANTLDQALDTRSGKRVVTVSVDPVNQGVLDQLGNAGSLTISSFGELAQVFVDIQDDLEAFVNSFYNLNYLTPRASGEAATFQIGVANNVNTSGATIGGDYDPSELVSPVPGLYFEDTSLVPDGKDPLYVIDDGSREVPINVYYGEFGGTPNPPEFSFSANPSGSLSFAYTAYEDLPSDDARRNVPQFGGLLKIEDVAAAAGDTIDVTVTDSANGHSEVLQVEIAYDGYDFAATDATSGWQFSNSGWSISDGKLRYSYVYDNSSQTTSGGPYLTVPAAGGPYTFIVEELAVGGSNLPDELTLHAVLTGAGSPVLMRETDVGNLEPASMSRQQLSAGLASSAGGASLLISIEDRGSLELAISGVYIID